eukprot:TRINITY_DN50655_c0_g1_i1.p2 TRINITY_DN50655_c0_g1~~TRINITY_DN50655_c0_g1_i1.p2  ORF type:complete len:194 (-),score=35.94 TRINITY_DN50655_c0_g1_i1:475-1017(-)
MKRKLLMMLIMAQIERWRQRRARARRREPQNAEQFYQRGMYAMDIQDFDSAESCFEKASILAPSNGRILEAYGSLLAELGKGDKATEILMRAVEVSPDKGFEKYMYLGQIMEGEMGALHVRKGIQIIKEDLSKAQHNEEISILKSAYCSALCALSEQLMQIGMEKLESADQQMEVQILQE